MFNVFDPKTIRRGSVPVQVLPRDEELTLLRGLANPNDPQVSPEKREAAVVALAKLEQEMASEQKTFVQSWEIYECQLPGHPRRTRHVVGKVNFAGEVAVSPALISINSSSREAEDETGSVWVFGGQVQGSPGVDTKWAWWRDKNGATDVKCVTQEVRDSLLSKWEKK